MAQAYHACAVLLDALRLFHDSRELPPALHQQQAHAHGRSQQLAAQLSRALQSPPCVPPEWRPFPPGQLRKPAPKQPAAAVTPAPQSGSTTNPSIGGGGGGGGGGRAGLPLLPSVPTTTRRAPSAASSNPLGKPSDPTAPPVVAGKPPPPAPPAASSTVTVYSKGEEVWYRDEHGRWQPSKVNSVHFDDPLAPYYSIAFPLYANSTRETEAARLAPRKPNVPPPTNVPPDELLTASTRPSAGHRGVPPLAPPASNHPSVAHGPHADPTLPGGVPPLGYPAPPPSTQPQGLSAALLAPYVPPSGAVHPQPPSLGLMHAAPMPTASHHPLMPPPPPNGSGGAPYPRGYPRRITYLSFRTTRPPPCLHRRHLYPSRQHFWVNPLPCSHRARGRRRVVASRCHRLAAFSAACGRDAHPLLLCHSCQRQERLSPSSRPSSRPSSHPSIQHLSRRRCPPTLRWALPRDLLRGLPRAIPGGSACRWPSARRATRAAAPSPPPAP